MVPQYTLLLQLVSAKPQVVATPAVAAPYNYPFLNPYSNCPDYLNWPPYYYFCDCNFYYCLDAAMQARVQTISTQYGIDLCAAQQWAILIENNMLGIDYTHETGMLTDLSAALRTEMNSRGLAFVDPPSYCANYADVFTGAPATPAVAPITPAAAPLPAVSTLLITVQQSGSLNLL